MVKKILIVLAVLVIGFLVVVAVQPNEFRIERSATMDAPPEVVFAQVNDLHRWEHWSPWAKRDPAAKNTFEGANEGEGAIFKWAGNNEVGEGKMTIVKSQPNQLINIQLDFIKPFEGTNNAEFTFKPEGDKTLVTWAMYGKRNFMEKGMCMIMNVNKKLGDDFESGLTNMKSVVEREHQPATETADATEDSSGEAPETEQATE